MMDGQRPHDAEAAARKAADLRMQRILKGAILVMTILLVGGVAVIGGTILARLAGGNGLRVTADLTVPGDVRSFSLDGNHLAVLVEDNEGQAIHIYDLESGRRVGEVRLRSARPAQSAPPLGN